MLEVKNGKAGQTVSVVCGESLSGDLDLDLVGNTWGWEQQWTLRDGAQTLVQHKYVLDAVCCVYTCRRLIDLSLIAGQDRLAWGCSSISSPGGCASRRSP